MIDTLIQIHGGREVEGLIEMTVLHSLLEREDQMRIFDPIPSGVTRLILATNIAESSITIPQLHYVIDMGLNKQVCRLANSSFIFSFYIGIPFLRM